MRELIDALKGGIVAEKSLKNDFSGHFSSEITPIAAPSKMELATQWLKEHPEDAALPGRELEVRRRPMNVKISFKTWNDAKKAADLK